jgi:GTPase SAR1 family protein
LEKFFDYKQRRKTLIFDIRKMDETRNIKILVSGSGGKTSLLIRYALREFPHEYVPSIFDIYTTILNFNEKKVSLSLEDTGTGFEELIRERKFENDLFLLCFSVINTKSLYDLEKIFIPEIKSVNDNKIRFILVGKKYF